MPVSMVAELITLGVADFMQQMQQAGSVVNSVASMIQAAFQGIESAVEAGLKAAVSGFIDFTRAAVTEASKVETMRLSLTALTGSASGAADMIKQLREYSLLGVGEFDNLTQAAIRLYAAGLNPLRLIKLVDVVGKMVQPQDPKQGSFQVADALARGASGGNFGRAMMVFRKIGIGYGDLIAEGLKVSAGNKITEVFEGQFIEAIEKIFKKKHLDQLGTMLEQSMSVKFSNLTDAWNYMLDSFGKAWFPLISEILDSIQPFIKWIAQSGEMQKIGTAFADAFGSLFGNAGGRGAITNFLTFVLTAFEMMPTIIDRLGHVMLNVGRTIGEFFIRTLNHMTTAALEIINPIRAMVGNMFEGLRQMTGGAIGSDPGLKELRTPIKFTPFANFGDMFARAINSLAGGAGMGDIPGEFNARYNQHRADFDKYMKSPQTGFADHSQDQLFNALHTSREGVDAEKQTAVNTGRVAASMEHFKRYALGGGERGKSGITLTEQYGSASTIRVNTRAGAGHFERGFEVMAMETAQSMRRSGMGGH